MQIKCHVIYLAHWVNNDQCTLSDEQKEEEEGKRNEWLSPDDDSVKMNVIDAEGKRFFENHSLESWILIPYHSLKNKRGRDYNRLKGGHPPAPQSNLNVVVNNMLCMFYKWSEKEKESNRLIVHRHVELS